MTKKAISVTLRPENLLWLRGQTQASSRRSVSETLDELISEARTDARGRAGSVKSVVGSIRIQASDPGLTQADAAIRGLFSPLTTRNPRRRRRSEKTRASRPGQDPPSTVFGTPRRRRRRD